VDAIADGLQSTTLQSKQAELESQEAELAWELASPPAVPVRRAPDLAPLHRTEIERLTADQTSVDRPEACELIRRLIDRVTVMPAFGETGRSVGLEGDLAAMIGVSQNAEGRRKPKLSAADHAWFARSVKVVTGKRNHRQLTSIRGAG